MDAPAGSLAHSGDVVPLHDLSVLIVESHPQFLESLPRTLKGTMPEVVFDVCASRDDGLSKLETGRYHTVISDPRLAEAADYSLLRRTQSLSCPVPFLLSEKPGDSQVVSRALTRGALDMIRCSFSGFQASQVIRRALWLYRLRLTIHNRRQRLDAFRLRHAACPRAIPELPMRLVGRTLEHIEKADFLCHRTIDQIESSVRVLEGICRQVESEARACALRVVRLL
jgi:DNA-binding NarL/FixJ family response regulator